MKKLILLLVFLLSSAIPVQSAVDTKAIDSPLRIAEGRVDRHSYISKFGNASDIDTADGFVDIWDGAGNANASKTYTFSTGADIDSISSSNAGDTQDIEIQGLNLNWVQEVQTVTLNGQTRVALSTPLFRVFRAKNVGSTDNAGDVYIYENGAITAGVPDTAGDIRAIIEAGNNQTLMAIYSVPINHTGYIYDWYASMSQKVAASSNVKIKFRKNGGVFQLKHISNINSTGSSRAYHEYAIPVKVDEQTDIIFSADSSANNNGVAAGFDMVLVEDE